MILELMDAMGGWAWVVLGLFLLIAEAFGAAGFLLGAAAAAVIIGFTVVAYPNMHWHYQFLGFGGLAFGLSVIYWKFFRKFNDETDRPLLNNRAAQYVGKHYKLEKAIESGSGKIQIGDTLWSVVSKEDIPAGSKVEVVGVKGSALVVRAPAGDHA